nr:cellulose binding domain-containing protein [Planosporangium thailandense]
MSIFLAQRLHPNLTGQRNPGRPNPTARHAAPPPSERPGCVASFAVSSTWQSGFRATVTVRATGAAAIDGWTVTWTFPGDQAVMQMWNGQYTQTHSKVTVQSEGWNGSPSPKGAARFGFIASGDTPTAVQDLACTVSLATASPSRR